MKIKLEIHGSPKGFDVAFSSVDYLGSPGNLNQFILKELGLDPKKNLPKTEKLSQGVVQIADSKNKCKVIFVVTLGKGTTEELLEKNFKSALLGFAHNWKNKRVWIPLLGVGDGRLDYEKSFDIIFNELNQIVKNEFAPSEIVFSIPKEVTEETVQILLDKIASGNTDPENIKTRIEVTGGPDNGKDISSVENFLENKQRKFFAAGHFWGGDNKWDYFIEKGIWENGHDKKTTNVVNGVNEGDVIFIKSTFVEKGISILRIKAIGLVTGNPKDGHLLKVNWHLINHIDLPKLGGYRNAISRIGTENVKKILEGLNKELPDLIEIIESLERLIVTDDTGVEKTPLTKEKEEKLLLGDNLIKFINSKSGRNNWYFVNRSRVLKLKDIAVDLTGFIEGRDDDGTPRSIEPYFDEIAVGDLALGFDSEDNLEMVVLTEITKVNTATGFEFKVLHYFENKITLGQIINSKLNFEKSFTENSITLNKLNLKQFQDLIILSEAETESIGSEKGRENIENNDLTSTILDNDGAMAPKDLLDFENDIRAFSVTLAQKN